MSETPGSFSPRIVDSLVDAVVILESEGRVLYANPAFGRLLGRGVEDLFGLPFAHLVPEPRRAAFWEDFNEIMAADPPRSSQAPRPIVVLRADGSELPVDVATFLVAPDVGPRLVVAVVWDVRGRIDIDRYQRVSDDLLAFLAGASGSLEVIIPRLLEVVASSMDFELATAWRWDPELEELQCEHVWRRDETDFETMAAASNGMTVASGEGLAGLVVNSDELIWQSDLPHAVELKRHAAIAVDGLQTAFALPIRTRDHLVGVIELFTRTPRQPDAPLVGAVGDICAKLGEFIERMELEAQRTGLIEQLERSQRHQQFLLQAARALSGARDFRDCVERLASVALPTLGDVCLIDVVTPGGKLQRLAAKHADRRLQELTDELRKMSPDIEGSHPAARALQTGESQWSSLMDDEFMRNTTNNRHHFDLIQTLHFESYVSVPLVVGGEALGALTVVTTGMGRKFGTEELVLAETLASQVASVIHRARQFDEQSTISHLLQTSLLPDHLGRHPGVAVAARYVAGSQVAEVGGDFYDVVELTGGRLALVIGDVEGHDMTAATVMGELRSALRAYLLIEQDPGAVLGLLDHYAFLRADQRLATTCLAVLDTSTRTLELASAGHPMPLLAPGRDPAALLRADPGPPVGIGEGAYATARFVLPDSGTLVLFTDGLIDDGRDDAPERISTLASLLKEDQTRDTEALADSIVRVLGPSRPGDDDLAVLAVHWPSEDASADS